MKALVYKGPERVEIVNSPGPVLSERQNVLVRVAFAGICGSDITVLHGKHPRVRAPLIMGHEFSGQVVDIVGRPGSASHNNETDAKHGIKPVPGEVPEVAPAHLLKRGMRVAVRPTFSCGECSHCSSGRPNLCRKAGLFGMDEDGGFAEYVAVPEENVYPLPEQVSLKEGAMIEPLAVAVHAVRRAGAVGRPPGGNAVALVLGAGPIGLLIAQVLRVLGLQSVIISEINHHRLKLAARLGFEAVDGSADPQGEVARITGGAGVDLLFDAAGIPSITASVTKLIRSGGELVQVAIHKQELVPVDLRDIVYREINLWGSFVYLPSDFSDAISLAAGARGNLQALISHSVDVDRGLEGFAIAQTDPTAVKVLIQIS